MPLLFSQHVLYTDACIKLEDKVTALALSSYPLFLLLFRVFLQLCSQLLREVVTHACIVPVSLPKFCFGRVLVLFPPIYNQLDTYVECPPGNLSCHPKAPDLHPPSTSNSSNSSSSSIAFAGCCGLLVPAFWSAIVPNSQVSYALGLISCRGSRTVCASYDLECRSTVLRVVNHRITQRPDSPTPVYLGLCSPRAVGDFCLVMSFGGDRVQRV